MKQSVSKINKKINKRHKLKLDKGENFAQDGKSDTESILTRSEELVDSNNKVNSFYKNLVFFSDTQFKSKN